MKSLLVIILSVLAIVGCGQTKERIVTKVEYVLVTPEWTYLKPTPIPKPSTPPALADRQKPDFEGLYVNAGLDMIDLYAALGQCNADKMAAMSDIETKKVLYGR